MEGNPQPRAGARLAVALCAALLCLLMPTTAAAKGAPKGFYGVVPQEALSAGDYANLAAGNVGTARISFNWASFQQVKGRCKPKPTVAVCSWTVMDAVLASLAQSGVRALPILYGSPGFISKKASKPPLKGKGKKGWKSFLKAAAKRYGRKGVFWKSYDDYGAKPMPIKDWQVWNEPNSKQFWHPSPNARKYAKLVKASSKALGKGDKKADVVLGGMFADAKVPIVPYMRKFYKAKKIRRHFDDLAIHPYAPSIGGLKRQLRSARKAARGHTGIRVTEMGWSSRKGGHPLNKGKKGQAKLLKSSFRLLTKKRRSWNITGINWFALRDTNNRETCVFCRRAGLFSDGDSPKPSWRAFKKFSK